MNQQVSTNHPLSRTIVLVIALGSMLVSSLVHARAKGHGSPRPTTLKVGSKCLKKQIFFDGKCRSQIWFNANLGPAAFVLGESARGGNSHVTLKAAGTTNEQLLVVSPERFDSPSITTPGGPGMKTRRRGKQKVLKGRKVAKRLIRRPRAASVANHPPAEFLAGRYLITRRVTIERRNGTQRFLTEEVIQRPSAGGRWGWKTVTEIPYDGAINTPVCVPNAPCTLSSASVANGCIQENARFAAAYAVYMAMCLSGTPVAGHTIIAAGSAVNLAYLDLLICLGLL